jgi:hypothetical protein
MAKRIFISDVHMGDSRGLKQGNGLHRYCWFYAARQVAHVTENRPEMLADKKTITGIFPGIWYVESVSGEDGAFRLQDPRWYMGRAWPLVRTFQRPLPQATRSTGITSGCCITGQARILRPRTISR